MVKMAGTTVTLRVAGLLMAPPTELLAETVNMAPLSAEVVGGVV
jgi:hypothetical protein